MVKHEVMHMQVMVTVNLFKCRSQLSSFNVGEEGGRPHGNHLSASQM